MLANIQKIQSLLKQSPFCEWLGVTVTGDNDQPIIFMPFAEHHIGNVMIRAIHGGIQASFMETAASAIFALESGAKELPRILNSDISYLRGTKDYDCSASVKFLRHGKRLATLEVTSWQD